MENCSCQEKSRSLCNPAIVNIHLTQSTKSALRPPKRGDCGLSGGTKYPYPASFLFEESELGEDLSVQKDQPSPEHIFRR